MRFMMKSEIHRCDPLIFHSYERVRIHHSTTSSRIQIILFVHSVHCSHYGRNMTACAQQSSGLKQSASEKESALGR